MLHYLRFQKENLYRGVFMATSITPESANHVCFPGNCVIISLNKKPGLLKGIYVDNHSMQRLRGLTQMGNMQCGEFETSAQILFGIYTFCLYL